jgi:pyruvate/2-oxoacid:ferredoxin oxidoreductase beta subunit
VSDYFQPAPRVTPSTLRAALAAHRIPYAATASIGYPQDMIRKFEKAEWKLLLKKSD